jgi:hypothetical protein
MADHAASGGKTAEALVAAYGSAKMMTARLLAEVEYEYALGQPEFVRAEMRRLIGEIEIEDAGGYAIGDEARSARMREAAWQRAVEAVAGYIQRLDGQIAER